MGGSYLRFSIWPLSWWFTQATGWYSDFVSPRYDSPQQSDKLTVVAVVTPHIIFYNQGLLITSPIAPGFTRLPKARHLLGAPSRPHIKVTVHKEETRFSRKRSWQKRLLMPWGWSATSVNLLLLVKLVWLGGAYHHEYNINQLQVEVCTSQKLLKI